MLRSSDPFENPKETNHLLETDSLCDISHSEINHESQRKGALSGPDGLRAWMVALANFLINFIVGGLGRMSGILYVVFMELFHIDRGSASMPFSVQQAIRNVFGPVAGILGQKYGVRNVTIVGGFIGIVSVGACYFVMSITWITVLWGIGFGICAAFTTTLNQVPIDLYFNKHRTTAGGLSISGGCVAAFIFPIVLDCLISVHGMSVTFLVMSVVVFFVIPISTILVEPPWNKKSAEKDGISETRNGATKQDCYNTFAKCSIKETKETPEIVDFEFLRQNSEYVYQLFVLTISDVEILPESVANALWQRSDTSDLVNELEDLYKFLLKTLNVPSGSFVDSIAFTRSANGIMNRPSYQNSTDLSNSGSCEIAFSLSSVDFESYKDNPRWLFLATKLQKLCEFRERALLTCFSIEYHDIILRILRILKVLNDWRVETDSLKIENKAKSLNASPHFLDEISEFKRKKQVEKERTQTNSFMEHIKTALKLHMNPIFLLICLCRTVFMMTFIPLVTIIVDFAMDKGMPKSSGKYFIALLSLGDLIGRMCLGWINDIGWVSLPTYMLASMLFLAVSLATLPFMHSEWTLMAAVLIFGTLQGSLFIRHQVLCTRYLDVHEQAIGMGLKNFLSGLVGLVIPFYIGYFRDTLGSYDNMFYLNGAITAFVGLMWMFEPYFVQRSKNKVQHSLLDTS